MGVGWGSDGGGMEDGWIDINMDVNKLSKLHNIKTFNPAKKTRAPKNHLLHHHNFPTLLHPPPPHPPYPTVPPLPHTQL